MAIEQIDFVNNVYLVYLKQTIWTTMNEKLEKTILRIS